MNRGKLDDEYRVKEQQDLTPGSYVALSRLEEPLKRRAFPVLLALFLAIMNVGTLYPGNSSIDPTTEIQTIIGDFLLRLGIAEKVEVKIEAYNKRLVSVECVRRPEAAFLMSFDERFLSELTEEELQATIAHEMGHIWIFTHHPYLQTEELANQIALKLVPRELLEQIYERVAHTVPRTTLREINHLPPDDRITP